MTNPAFENPIYDLQPDERPLPSVPPPPPRAYANAIYDDARRSSLISNSPTIYEQDRISYTTDGVLYSEPSHHRKRKGLAKFCRDNKRGLVISAVVVVLLIGAATIAAIVLAEGQGSSTPSEPMIEAQTGEDNGNAMFSGSMKVVDGPYSVYKQQFASHNNADFQEWLLEFGHMMERIFMESPAKELYSATTIRELRAGSVVAYFYLKYQGSKNLIKEYNARKTLGVILKGAVDENMKGQFVIDLSSISLQEGDVPLEPELPITTQETITTAVTTATQTASTQTASTQTASTQAVTTDTTTVSTTTQSPNSPKTTKTDSPSSTPATEICTQSDEFVRRCVPVVMYNTTSTTPYWGQQTEEFLGKVFQQFENQNISDKCRLHIPPFLCSIVYPQCTEGKRLPPCQEYCMAMYTGCWQLLGAILNINDCLNFGATQQKCTKTPDLGVICSTDQFFCRNGPLVSSLSNCISARRRCNSEADCLDGTDELNCPARVTCPTGETPCVNGTVINSDTVCLSINQLCNGRNDCTSGSDEQGCDVECSRTEYRCKYGLRKATTTPCIPSMNVCDQVMDCTDGSDEIGCNVTRCSPKEFRCLTGVDRYNRSSCVLNIYRCDRDKDCYDGSDEVNCTEAVCPSDQISCVTGHRRNDPQHGICFPRSGVCDGVFDCEDKSDEQNCTSCLNEGFRCKNGTSIFLGINVCLDKYDRCDGFIDCTDSSDELDCPAVECAANQFACMNGYFIVPSVQCLPDSYRCDGIPDCSDASDESTCTYQCNANEFKCTTGVISKYPYRGYCIPQSQVCDSLLQCADYSDEANCTSITQCSAGLFWCGATTGRRCIGSSEVCDSISDCYDGRDETDCRKCGAGEIKCKNGYIDNNPKKRCYTFAQRCDGVPQCSDSSDERECSSRPQSCGYYNRYRCRNGFQNSTGNRCVSNALLCDRVKDCSDGSDELGCTYRCGAQSFMCRNGTIRRYPYNGFCLGIEEECDGYVDCLDGSDEVDCQNKPCPPGYWRCTNGAHDVHNRDYCIPNRWICDRENDCSNNSDESSCPARG